MAQALHAGALQDLLVAKQELQDMAAPVVGEQVDRAITSLAAASVRLREAIFELHPVLIDHPRLGPGLQQLAGAFTERTGIVITTSVDDTPPRPIDQVVLGVVRELLANVVRHSRAERASVTLLADDDSYLVDVIDDGLGLTPEAAASRMAQGCLGLAANRARVAALGGALRVVASERGAHVQVWLPVAGQ